MLENEIVFLFDVDGVLIDAQAYKAAIKQVLAIIAERIGQACPENFALSDAEIAYFESCGIHDVWDICNIALGLLFLGLFEKLYETDLLIDLPLDPEHCFLLLKSLGCGIKRPNYLELAHLLVEFSRASDPPVLAMEIFGARLDRYATKFADSWKVFLNGFLAGSRSVYGSYATRMFQNLILGKTDFELCYGLPAIYACSSLLTSKDAVLVSKENVAKLLRAQGLSLAKMAIYTARPSSMPPDLVPERGYSPEAERAALMSGLDSVPLIGMGSMDWLAKKHNRRSQDLVKPNLTQAAAALLAAVLQDCTSQVLELAYDLALAIETKGELPDLAIQQLVGKDIHVYLFEDTSSGVKPMLDLIEYLNLHFGSVCLTVLGISSDKNKRKSLEKYSGVVFDDINQALEFVFADLELRENSTRGPATVSA